MALQSRERFGHRVRIGDIDRVPLGYHARYLLRAGPEFTWTVSAALALAKRHVPLAEAKSAVERLVDRREITLGVPKVENFDVLERDLAELGIRVLQAETPDRVSPR